MNRAGLWIGNNDFETLLRLGHDGPVELFGIFTNQIGLPDQGAGRQIGTDARPRRRAILCDGIELRHCLVEIARVKVSSCDLITSIGTQHDVAGIESCRNCMRFSSAIGKDLVLRGSPFAQIGILKPELRSSIAEGPIAF